MKKLKNKICIDCKKQFICNKHLLEFKKWLKKEVEKSKINKKINNNKEK